MRRGEHLPARSDKEPVQGVRRGGHLPARSEEEHVQGVRRGEHLPAQSAKVPMQGLRGRGHLPAQSEKEPMQGVRRGQHLPAQSDKEQVQDVHSRQGRVHAAGSRGALRHINTSLCHCQSLLPPACIFRFSIRHTKIYCAHGLVHDLINDLIIIPPICVATRSFQYSPHTRRGRRDGRLDAPPAAPCLIVRQH